MKLEFPDEVGKTVRQLNDAGYQAYAVGGCIRDTLLEKVPNDWDLTTSALPEQMKQVFAGERILETGIRHGTLTLLRNGPLEITTYRIDGEYTDARRPDSVQFTASLREDLARRDFTVNAIAGHPEEGIIDCFHGCDDLKAGILRCVGDPERRFQEDALRILRAVRFSSVLDFQIEENTLRALLKCRGNLVHVAGERIFSEMKKMLCGISAEQALLASEPVFEILLPEIDPHGNWAQIAGSMPFLRAEPSLRLAALLQETDTETASEFLSRLRTDSDTRQTVLTLIQHLHTVIPSGHPALLRLAGEIGEENLFRLAELQSAAASARKDFSSAEEIRSSAASAEKLFSEGACIRISDLKTDGKALIQLGVPSGPLIGKILHDLLFMVQEDKIPNESGALTETARRMIDILH